ncbi:MAG: tyrosine decarboxylase MfnA [Thermoplasmatota archaeon]
MDRQPWPPEAVRTALHDARSKDLSFAQGEILGSMCTEPHALAQEVYGWFLPTNLGDPDHFPGTAQLERDVLADLAQLVSAPGAEHARFLTGGTEANLQACYLARETTGRNQVVISGAAHFSFEKATRMLGMELIRVPAGDDLRSDPDAMAAAISDDTALVVAIAGSTELGLVDDIPAIAAAAQRVGAHCHVDGAFGGYVLPFLEIPWDLRVPGVTSVALDPHKMGMAPVPAGALVVADASIWQATAVETSYVSTDSQSTLMGTRPGAAVAATWAAHRATGLDGYESNAHRCIASAKRLAQGLKARGASLVAEPELNVVTFHHGDVKSRHARLMSAGFRLNIVPRFEALRIVVGPHVTDDIIDRFLESYDQG